LYSRRFTGLIPYWIPSNCDDLRPDGGLS